MNAIRYGWGKHGDLSEPFWVKFNPVTREVKSWNEEIYAAARAVMNTSTKPLLLCSSGGIDSEIMCRAFYDQGIHFTVLTIEHAAGTNVHDTRFVKKWCRKRGVEQKVVKLDMPDFLSTGVRAYADQSYITGNIFRYFQLKLLEEAERLGGHAVLGGGEQLYHVDPSKSVPEHADTYLEFETGYAVPLEWCRRNRAAHEPYFFFSTPELCLSYLNIPIVAFAVRHPDIFRNANNRFVFKQLTHQAQWPDIRPRKKMNGYEKITSLRAQAQDTLKKEFGQLIQVYRLPIATFAEQLSSKSPAQV